MLSEMQAARPAPEQPHVNGDAVRIAVAVVCHSPQRDPLFGGKVDTLRAVIAVVEASMVCAREIDDEFTGGMEERKGMSITDSFLESRVSPSCQCTENQVLLGPGFCKVEIQVCYCACTAYAHTLVAVSGVGGELSEHTYQHCISSGIVR